MIRRRLPIIFVLAWMAGCRNSPEPPLPIIADVPDFQLIDEAGKPIERRDLLGKVWVADFIFTHCAGPCPLMSRRMAGVQHWLRGTEGVMLVSFSVDPDRDKPEILREYATRYKADHNVWKFVTGDKQAIFKLAIDGFKLTVSDATATDPILHSTRFILVDKRGRIRGVFNGEEDAGIDALTSAIRRLVREPNP